MHSRTITYDDVVDTAPTRSLRLRNPDFHTTNTTIPTARIIELPPEDAQVLVSQINDGEIPRTSRWARFRRWFGTHQREIWSSLGVTVVVIGLISASVAAPPVALILVGCIFLAVVGGAVSLDFLKRRREAVGFLDQGESNLNFTESSDA
jgi:hypothetical protein